MTTDLLITFLKLVEVRNYTRTAEELFISQSTVTTRINTLEEELGTDLFIRNHKGLQLTPAGETFLVYAKGMLNFEKTAAQNVKLAASNLRQLRIGATETIFEGYLLPLMKDYIASHRQYHEKYLIGESVDLLQKLQEGQLDIVYISRPLQKKGYICTHLSSEPFCIAVSPSYENAEKKISLEKLLKTDLIYTNYALSFTNQWMEELFPPHHIFPIDIHDGTKALRMALHGIGYCILPFSLCDPYFRNGELLQVESLDFHLPLYQIFAVRAEDSPEDLVITRSTRSA